MSSGVATAYPWNALPRVGRSAARRGARARREVQGSLDLQRIGAALSELTECEAEVLVQRVTTDAPRRRPLTELGFELGNSGVTCVLSLEPELATMALARLLRRPLGLSAQAPLDDALSGALSALLLELARRCSARAPLHLLPANDALARANEVFVEATVVLAGSSYAVVAGLGLPELPREAPRSLAALGELTIGVPLVIGCSLAERATLRDFVPGNAWFPGTGLWLDVAGAGAVALAAASHDSGLCATLSADGKIVLRGGAISLLPDPGEVMPDSAKPEASLTDAVLDSPVIVRVEVGTVSLTAREWAELGPGDVIETGRRIAEPVVLRVAGREVARGELVNLEGELGVRIRELVPS